MLGPPLLQGNVNLFGTSEDSIVGSRGWWSVSLRCGHRHFADNLDLGIQDKLKRLKDQGQFSDLQVAWCSESAVAVALHAVVQDKPSHCSILGVHLDRSHRDSSALSI